ncbi:MAG: ATP-binding protein, partial [Cyanobacteria bacterium P01_C01_bin.70]
LSDRSKLKNLWGRVILGGTAVIVCAASYWSYQTVRNLLLENLQDIAFLEAQQGANEIDSWLSAHKAKLSAIANSPTLRTMDWALIEPYLQFEEERLPDFIYLGITDADMLLYTTSSPEKNGEIDLSDRKHVQDAMMGINSLSDPLLSRSLDGASIVVFAIPTFSGQATSTNPLGEPIGAINGVVGTDRIVEVVNSLDYGNDSYAFAINSKGEAIVHPDSELMSTIEKPAPNLLEYGDPGLAEITQNALNQESGLGLYEIGGQPQYVAYVPLTEADWSVALVIPRSNIEGQLRPLDLIALVVVGLTGTMLIVLWRVQSSEQEQLKRSKVAADMANQAKSEFLANMSHELRTPLNGILGYAQILEQRLTGKDRDGIKVIYQCGSHLLTLINDVLDLSKIEARKLELVSSGMHFPALLQSVVEMCCIKAEEKGLEFVYQPSPHLPEGIQADEKRLRQVLINLLSNAIKFTDAGKVTLQIDVVDKSDTTATLRFQVMDTGVGIAENDAEKLFQAFEQVGDQKKQSEGTGLGLAISQRIVRLMGGAIEFNSQVGEGSTFFFTVELPLAEDWVAQQGTLAGGDRILGYEGDRQTILVVDDRWENRAVVKNLLTSLDFTIIEADNGETGLEQLRAEQPHLVITDLAMPVMDGYEFLNKLRGAADTQSTKVIVSSASVSNADRQTAINAGGDAFLPKPVDASTLFQVLADQLALTWVYAETPETDAEEPHTRLVLPPDDILASLLDLANQGFVSQIRTRLEDLMAADQKYTPFANSILTLAKQFQVEEIEDLLKTYIDERRG